MKNLRTLAVLVALVSVAFLGLVPAARSDTAVIDGDTYAAIAYSPSTGKFGYAYNYGSRWSAERAALQKCPTQDARIVCWVNNGFCALALGDDKSTWGTGWSFGDGATNRYAMRRALAEAGKRTRNARIVLCVCSSDAFAPYKP